jgi:hypothetical protein
MSAQAEPLGAAADKYAAVREAAGGLLVALADVVQVQNDERLNHLPRPVRELVIAERDSVRVVTWYGREAAHTLSEYQPADGLAVMFGHLENACMSAGNLVMLLRCMEGEP